MLTLTTQTFALIRTPEEAAALVAGGCGCDTVPLSAQTFAVDDSPEPGPVQWSGVIGVEGELTGDGRMIEPNALRWENLPIPLRYAAEDVGGHDGAQVVGRILTISRGSDGAINATGDIDMGSEAGREYARHLREGLTTGISMDLDSVSFEVRVARDLMEGGGPLAALFDDPEDGEAEAVEEDEDGRVTVMEVSADDEVMVTTDARIRAATGVAIPAFAGARIALTQDAAPEAVPTAAAASGVAFARMEPIDGEAPEDATCAEEGCDRTPTHVVYEGDEPIEDEVGTLYCEEHASDAVSDASDDGDEEAGGDAPALALIAGGAFPAAPPQEWFDNPNLSEPTPVTITEDGRIYGHLAVWGTCHTAYTGQCVEPPHSPSGYSYFRTGAVLTAEGSEVPTGVITLDTLHAGRNLSAAQTLAHYEHTGRGVADVSAGEDVHGIWVAGALRPGVTEEQVRALRASPLSGDWRRVGTGLELVAALAVNVPGFPVPRPQGLVASGVMQSLVASGMLAPRRVIPPGLPGSLTVDDLRYLKRLAARERRAEAEEKVGIQTKADALAARLRATRADALARRVGVR